MDIHPDPALRMLFWMRHVSALVPKARYALSFETIHALRTSLRRCLALVKTLPDPLVREITGASRTLFEACALLRDLQVMQHEIAPLPLDRKVRRNLLEHLAGRMRPARTRAMKAVRDFDRAKWRILMRKVRVREISHRDRQSLKQAALKRIRKVRKLYERCARRGASCKDFHRLRIALKKFRYIIENYFPAFRTAHGRTLKKLQDTLGRHQDLVFFKKEAAAAGCLTETLQKLLEKELGALRCLFWKIMAGREIQALWRRWETELRKS